MDGHRWSDMAGTLDTNVNIDDLNQKGSMMFPTPVEARYVKIICKKSHSGGPNGGARVALLVT
jgi:hypothetical protein